MKQTALILSVVVLFAGLLHFPWEMWQISFFEGMESMSHGEAVLMCTKATLGDALVTGLAYLFGAIVIRDDSWVLKSRLFPLTVYMLTGLTFTIAMEYLATEVWGRWAYSISMPILPGVGTGALPLLQWIVIPPVCLYLTKVYLIGRQAPR